MQPFALPLLAFGFGGTELVVILLIVLVLFGGAKLPALAKGLGESIREFKKAARDDDPAEKKAQSTEKKPGDGPATPQA